MNARGSEVLVPVSRKNDQAFGSVLNSARAASIESGITRSSHV